MKTKKTTKATSTATFQTMSDEHLLNNVQRNLEKWGRMHGRGVSESMIEVRRIRTNMQRGLVEITRRGYSNVVDMMRALNQ